VEHIGAREVVGRYALFDVIASGGMATVYYGRLIGQVGFARTVAIKKLHPQHARDAEFVSMLVDEARLAARIRHPNVVPMLDVVTKGRELYLVMDYVLGVTLSELMRSSRVQQERIPPPVVASIISGCLQGLHAAHDTCDDNGAPLGIVHRDVSPQNILVGKDGMARLLDFGIATAHRRTGFTRAGDVKGKVAYMAPEQLRAEAVTRQADVYAAAVTSWEALTGLRAFVGNSDEIIKLREKDERLPPPSDIDPALAAFDAVVMRGLEPTLERRYPTAKAMALELELCAPLASHAEVADWIEQLAWSAIEQRSAILARIEQEASVSEVRAAMRDALSLESVNESDVESVYTTSDRSTLRNEIPTRVEPSSRDSDVLPQPTDAPTLAEPISEASRDRTSVPVAIDPRPLLSAPPPPPSSWTFHLVVFGGAAALIVGGILAFLALHGQSSASPAADPESAESADRPSPSTEDAETHETRTHAESEAPHAPATSSGRIAHPPAGARPPAGKKPPGKDDLFDSLGGRH
jgi:serine/threonine-protein kinase